MTEPPRKIIQAFLRPDGKMYVVCDDGTIWLRLVQRAKDGDYYETVWTFFEGGTPE